MVNVQATLEVKFKGDFPLREDNFHSVIAAKDPDAQITMQTSRVIIKCSSAAFAKLVLEALSHFVAIPGFFVDFLKESEAVSLQSKKGCSGYSCRDKSCTVVHPNLVLSKVNAKFLIKHKKVELDQFAKCLDASYTLLPKVLLEDNDSVDLQKAFAKQVESLLEACTAFTIEFRFQRSDMAKAWILAKVNAASQLFVTMWGSKDSKDTLSVAGEFSDGTEEYLTSFTSFLYTTSASTDASVNDALSSFDTDELVFSCERKLSYIIVCTGDTYKEFKNKVKKFVKDSAIDMSPTQWAFFKKSKLYKQYGKDSDVTFTYNIGHSTLTLSTPSIDIKNTIEELLSKYVEGNFTLKKELFGDKYRIRKLAETEFPDAFFAFTSINQKATAKDYAASPKKAPQNKTDGEGDTKQLKRKRKDHKQGNPKQGNHSQNQSNKKQKQGNPSQKQGNKASKQKQGNQKQSNKNSSNLKQSINKKSSARPVTLCFLCVDEEKENIVTFLTELKKLTVALKITASQTKFLKKPESKLPKFSNSVQVTYQLGDSKLLLKGFEAAELQQVENTLVDWLDENVLQRKTFQLDKFQRFWLEESGVLTEVQELHPQFFANFSTKRSVLVAAPGKSFPIVVSSLKFEGKDSIIETKPLGDIIDYNTAQLIDLEDLKANWKEKNVLVYESNYGTRNKKTLVGEKYQLQKAVEALRKQTEKFETKSITLKLSNRDFAELVNDLLQNSAKKKKQLQEEFDVFIKHIDKFGRFVEITGIDENIEAIKSHLESNGSASKMVKVDSGMARQIMRKNSYAICTELAQQFSGLTFHWINIKNSLRILGKSQHLTGISSRISEYFAALDTRTTVEEVELTSLEHQILKKKQTRLNSLANKTGTWIDIDGPKDIVKKLVVKYRRKVNFSLCVEVEFGNIVQKQCGAIVNACNEKLGHYGGVAKAISNAAGPKFQQDCFQYGEENGDISVGNNYVCQSYNLTNVAPYVINVVGPRWNDSAPDFCKLQLQQAFFNAFVTAEEEEFESIAVPMISSNIFGFPDKEVVSCAQKAVSQFMNETQGVLKTIVFVDINPDILDLLTTELETKIGPTNKSKQKSTISVAPTPRVPKYLIKWKDDDGSYKIYCNADLLALSDGYEAGNMMVPLVIDNKKYIAGAKYLVDFNNMVQVNTETTFKRPIIMKNNEIEEEQLLTEVEMPETVEDLETFKVSIRGLPADIIGANNALKEIIKKMISSLLFQDNGKFTGEEIDDFAAQYPVEISRVDSSNLVIKGDKNTCGIVEKKLLTQLLKHSQKKIARKFPDNWSEPIHEFQLVDLPSGHDEWKQVEALIQNTLSPKIISIQRIQNPYIWEQYQFHVKQMESFLGEAATVDLFHGTRGTDPSDIFKGETGFDMSFSNQGMWGRGNYFAVNASYSTNYCYSNGSNNQMMLVEVLVGQYEELSPNSNIKKPNIKPAQLQSGKMKNERYSSIKGNTAGSDVFIVYDNGRAYPKYLITYQ